MKIVVKQKKNLGDGIIGYEVSVRNEGAISPLEKATPGGVKKQPLNDIARGFYLRLADQSAKLSRLEPKLDLDL